MINSLIEHFGTLETAVDTDATYILTDGVVMDTFDGSKSQHECVAEYISSKYCINDLDENNGSKYMNSINAIRVTPWLNAFYLPEKRITRKQEDALLKAITKMRISDDKPLMISSLDGFEFIEFFSNDILSILDSIDGYYKYGYLMN